MAKNMCLYFYKYYDVLGKCIVSFGYNHEFCIGFVPMVTQKTIKSFILLTIAKVLNIFVDLSPPSSQKRMLSRLETLAFIPLVGRGERRVE